MTRRFWLGLTVVAAHALSCAREGAADRRAPAPAPAAPAPPPPASPPKDPPMSDQPIHRAPPPVVRAPAEDTARYVAWMAKRGTPVKDTPREEVQLRLGDWGFFEHGPAPGAALDRAALDRADHAVVPSDKGAWFALLSTKDLDAAGALRRAAWLLKGSPIDPTPKAPKVTPPTLAPGRDGAIVLQGWVVYPPNMGTPVRLTITASAKAVALVHESANQL